MGSTTTAWCPVSAPYRIQPRFFQMNLNKHGHHDAPPPFTLCIQQTTSDRNDQPTAMENICLELHSLSPVPMSTGFMLTAIFDTSNFGLVFISHVKQLLPQVSPPQDLDPRPTVWLLPLPLPLLLIKADCCCRRIKVCRVSQSRRSSSSEPFVCFENVIEGLLRT